MSSPALAESHLHTPGANSDPDIIDLGGVDETGSKGYELKVVREFVYPSKGVLKMMAGIVRLPAYQPHSLMQPARRKPGAIRRIYEVSEPLVPVDELAEDIRSLSRLVLDCMGLWVTEQRHVVLALDYEPLHEERQTITDLLGRRARIATFKLPKKRASGIKIASLSTKDTPKSKSAQRAVQHYLNRTVIVPESVELERPTVELRKV